MSHDLELNMADQDLDDFAFDEHGIYREVPNSCINGDQGINLDEDGIWRDDGDHWSHQTYRTYDSGIAINDHRSSSSTISRLPQVPADTDHVGYGHESNTTDSLLPDDKSLNISELEASESNVGDEISFEQRSFHSDENLDLPELIDESYLLDSETSKDRAEYGRDSATDRSEFGSSKISHHGGRDDERSDDDRDEPSVRRPPEYLRPDLSLDLGLLGRDANWTRSADEADLVERLDAVPPMARRRPHEPTFEAESLFTQEEPSSVFGGQSLVEFEELEAEVQTHLGEPPVDNLDLIGAYLHGLTQREAEEDDGNDSGDDQDQKRQDIDDGAGDGHPPDSLPKLYTTDQSGALDVSGDQNATSVLGSKTNQSDDVLQSHDDGQQIPLVGHADPSHEPSCTTSLSGKTFMKDDSVSESLESQKPPFDSLPFSTLEMSSGLRTDSGPDEQTESGQNSPRQHSKIPMLRSRSPLMSRPGSCSPRLNAHSTSPVVNRKQFSQPLGSPRHGTGSTPSPSSANKRNSSAMSYRGERGRSLPTTPLRDSQDRSAGDAVSAASAKPRDDATSSQAEENGSIEDLPELSSVGAQVWRSGVDFMPKLSRQSLLQKFKMTSHGQQGTASRAHPIRATGEAAEGHSSCDETYESEDLSQSSVLTADLKKRFLQEKEDRKEKELTLEQLQKEYNDLLKKHATAENLIDELRLGAKVTLYTDGPSPGQAQTGSVPPAQHAQVFNIPQVGTASVGAMGKQQNVGTETQQGAHPNSPVGNTASNKQATSSKNSTSTGANAIEITQEESSSIAEESAKLSLFAQSKSVEEQVAAFQILLNENAASLDEQDQGLYNIKQSMERLQQAYRDAKTEHEYRRRQGTTGRDSVFDPDKEVEGELYKLGMRIDDVEHTVQENLKRKFARIPFQSPLKADHDILVRPASMTDGAGLLEQADSEALSPRRPPSVGSIVGVSGDIDRTLHQLHKDYNALMDRYRKLKQLKKTPETDQEINSLLKNIKAIYEQTPDHRKPALPPELESLYNPVRGTFMTPDQQRYENRYREERKEQLASKPRSRNRRRVVDTTSTAVESSDVSSPERGHHNQSHSTLGKDSGSSSTHGDRSRRRRPVGRQLPDASSSSYRDSDWSTDRPHHGDRSNHGDPSHRGQHRQSGSTRSSSSSRHLPSKVSGRSSQRDDKNSGYMGSEGSRKRVKETSAGQSVESSRSARRGPIKTTALRSPDMQYSDSDTGSTASTVEEYSTKKNYRSSSDRQGNSQGSNSSRRHKVASEEGRESSDVNHRGRHSESEEVSMISGNRTVNRNETSGYNAVSGVMTNQSSAFQVKQTRPPLIQPRPIQPTQVATVAFTAAGMTAVSAPQYQYQYPAGVPTVSGAVLQPGGVMTNTGLGTMPGQVPLQYAPVVRQSQPRPPLSSLVQAQPPPALGGYNGVQAARPPDRLISESHLARGRSHSFGGGRTTGFNAQPLTRGRYRSTQALSGRYDDELDVHDRYDLATSACPQVRHRSSDDHGHRYTDRVWESHDARGSPYDYRKRFEQIREERYGRRSTYRDASQRARDFSSSEDDRHRKWRHAKRRDDNHHYTDDYSDYDQVRGYYSDPESPERYARSRDYYHPHSRTPDYYRPDYYDGPDVYANEYDTGPLDEKYLTSSGVGAAGFNGRPYGGVDMATRGIQNVPHMTTTGVQYLSESMVNPGLGPYPEYSAAANGYVGTGVDMGMGLGAGGEPGMAAAPGGYGYQLQGVAPAGQAAGINSSLAGEPVVVMASPGHVTNGVPTMPSGANYVPVEMVHGMAGVANGMPDGVPAVIMGGAAPGVGGSPTILRLVGDGTVRSPKVRYYVREYGMESDAELTNQRRNKCTPKRNVKMYDEDFQEEDDRDECLRAALKTARHLHKMSNKMKETLNQELSRTYRKSTMS